MARIELMKNPNLRAASDTLKSNISGTWKSPRSELQATPLNRSMPNQKGGHDWRRKSWTKLAQTKTRSPRSGKNKRQNRTPQAGNKNSFFIEIQIVYSSKSQRSPPSLPHLIIRNINFRSWLTNPRLKTKNVRSGEITISLLPLGPIYRTSQ
jgi:hypothetical protein